MSRILLVLILLPAAAALILLAKVILKPKKIAEPQYVEVTPDDEVRVVKDKMTDGLEEE